MFLLLQVLLVGDSDVGKQEILAGLDDGNTEWGSSYATSATGGAGTYSNTPYALTHGFYSTPCSKDTVLTAFKETIILIDGKRVKLQLWDTSGQGRFCTIIRSYSRGAQGILLVYDITNKWSFEGIDRWRKEVDQVGNKGNLQMLPVLRISVESSEERYLLSFTPIPHIHCTARARHTQGSGGKSLASGVQAAGRSGRS